MDPPKTADGNVKWYNYFGKQPTFSLFLNNFRLKEICEIVQSSCVHLTQFSLMITS